MKVINTEKAPGAIGPYSQGFVVGNLVITSGQAVKTLHKNVLCEIEATAEL